MALMPSAVFQVSVASSKWEVPKNNTWVTGWVSGPNDIEAHLVLFCTFEDSEFGTADAAAADGSRGSNVYEANPLLWQLGRGRPPSRIGGLSVSETEGRRDAVNRAGSKRSHETRRRREAARRGDE